MSQRRPPTLASAPGPAEASVAQPPPLSFSLSLPLSLPLSLSLSQHLELRAQRAEEGGLWGSLIQLPGSAPPLCLSTSLHHQDSSGAPPLPPTVFGPKSEYCLLLTLSLLFLRVTLGGTQVSGFQVDSVHAQDSTVEPV
jgi:hypothetical protein